MTYHQTELMPKVEYVDTIDCRDLFHRKDEKDRIEFFRIREIEAT